MSTSRSPNRIATWPPVLAALLLVPTPPVMRASEPGSALRSSGPAQAPSEAAKQFDSMLAATLFTKDTDLAPATTDAVFARRVWIDLVGDIPSPERLTAFLLDPAADKRAKLVRELLAKPQYGQNWGRYWRDVVFYRRLDDRSLDGAEPMAVWISTQLNNGVGWDRIASQMISAHGEVRENGAGGLILAQDGRTEETAAEVSRVFLGIQIQCAQCHDHPWDQWKREQFHELAAFFPRVGLRQVQTATRRTYAIHSNDRPERRKQQPRPNDNYRGVAEHRMPDLSAPDKPGARIAPRFFLTSAELPFGTRDAERRGRLAEWLTSNEWFAKAVVNRVWSELVGEGFFEPVDDIGPDREPTAGAALDHLAEQFASSGHDLRWLMETICATEAYQRESRPRRPPDGVPMAANTAQPLRGDQLFSVLLTALDIDESRSNNVTQRIAGMSYGREPTPRAIFNVAFGYDPSSPRESINASIPQALALMNGPRINAAVSDRRRSLLSRTMKQIEDNESLIEELYLRCYSRLPTSSEKDLALEHIASVNRRGDAMSDLLWALVNSAEFTHRR